MILYYTILYYTILYYTILYYTILYYTILWFLPKESKALRKVCQELLKVSGGRDLASVLDNRTYFAGDFGGKTEIPELRKWLAAMLTGRRVRNAIQKSSMISSSEIQDPTPTPPAATSATCSSVGAISFLSHVGSKNEDKPWKHQG